MLARPAGAQQVVQYTFEDGPDGWVSFNGASAPVSTTAAAHGGIPPSKYPVSLGDVGPGGMGSASFTVKFLGCRNDARLVLWAPWSSNVYDAGTLLEKDLQP